jgi:hypothetical protein
MEIDSDNAGDSPTGSGAQQLELNMVDASYNSHTILMGTPEDANTPRQVPNGPWLRCNGMRITQGGNNGQTGGANARLDLRIFEGSTKYASIPAGGSKWGGCIYTIPSDENTEFIAVNWEQADPGNNDDMIGYLFSRRVGNGENVWNLEVVSTVIDDLRTTATISLRGFVWDAGTDIVVRMLSNNADLTAAARLQFERIQRVGAL